jgi:hypothetical protein
MIVSAGSGDSDFSRVFPAMSHMTLLLAEVLRSLVSEDSKGLLDKSTEAAEVANDLRSLLLRLTVSSGLCEPEQERRQAMAKLAKQSAALGALTRRLRRSLRLRQRLLLNTSTFSYSLEGVPGQWC